jgi:hypothetical protein
VPEKKEVFRLKTCPAVVPRNPAPVDSKAIRHRRYRAISQPEVTRAGRRDANPSSQDGFSPQADTK